MSWMDDLKATCVKCGTRCVICPCKKLLKGVKQFLKRLISFILAPKCILCPFVKLAKFLWRYITTLFWRHKWVLYILLALFAIISCNLVVIHLYSISSKAPPGILQKVPDVILGLFGTSASELVEKKRYDAIVADMIAICAFIFAVLPILQAIVYKRKLKRELREEYGFEFVPVKKAGFDDIKEMLKRYRQADEVTIFSGGFDWIHENEDMKNLLLELASGSKLKLVSFRKYEKVKELFNNKSEGLLFEELHEALGENFKFDSPLDGIKCSLIKTLGENRLLFRQSSEEHEFNAGFLASSKYSRQLLGILFKFANKNDWGEPVPTRPARPNAMQPEIPGGPNKG